MKQAGCWSFVRGPGNDTAFSGGRGRFAVLEGRVADDTLHWLQGDPMFRAQGKSLRLSWATSEANRRTEAGTKVEVCGHMAGLRTRPNLTVHGLDASRPFPVARVLCWTAAFKLKNAGPLAALQAALLSRFEGNVDLGPNGRALVDVPPSDWLADLGTLQVMSPQVRADPRHWDGGGSLLLLNLTLWGHRTLMLYCAEGPDLRLDLHAGSVYLGVLTAAEHQVFHDGAPDETLVELAPLGLVKVSCVLRGRTFRHNRATLAARAPSPRHVLEGAQEVVVQWLHSHPLGLPTLAECQEQVARL